jgi:hypothetical protein
MCLSDRSKVKKLLYIFVALLAVSACQKAQDPKEVVAKVAQTYYDSLLAGNVKYYVEGTFMTDSIPAGYKEELETNMKMFIGQQQAEHQGIASAKVTDVSVDTATNTANVYMTLTYGDSTSEEVLVPMVEKNNVWYLR